MAATAIVDLAGRPVTIRELTVAEVRTWSREIEAGMPVDPLRCMVFEECSLDDLARMSDCPAEELEAYGRTDLQAVLDKAKAVNPYFFKVREVLFGISRILQQEAEAGLSSSTPS